MHVIASQGALCVVACDHGPVAAAVFVQRNGTLLRRKLWLRGPRPSWVRRATRNLTTLLVDYAAPTIAGGTIASDKMARLGTLDTTLTSQAQGCSVSVRADKIGETCEAALDAGMLSDLVTSLSALELATFLEDGQTADTARLSFHPGHAIFATRENGRVSVRRFALPAMSVEMDSALKLYQGPLLVIDGFLEIGGYLPENQQNRTVRDLRIADSDAVTATLLQRAAELHFAAKLAEFERPGERAKNTARRWLPPIALALGILCLAALAPLANARAKAAAGKLTATRMASMEADAKIRAAGNQDLMAHIEALSIRRNRVIDGISRTQRTVGTVMKIQQARRAERNLQVDTISIDDAGRKLTISGTLPTSASDEVGAFVDKLTKARFHQTSDLSLREDADKLRFSVNLEAKP